MKDELKASKMRSRQALHRSRAARVKLRRVFIITSFFVILLGASLFVGTIAMVRAFRSQTSATGLAAYGRTARVMYPLLDGEFCRYIVFDNKTAQTIEDKISRCDGGSRMPKRNDLGGYNWGSNGR